MDAKNVDVEIMKLFYGLPYESYHDAFISAFDKYFDHLMEDEGGYLPGKRAKQIGDRGGATNWGISLRFLISCGVDVGDLNNDGVVDEKDIVLLNKEQARELYFKYFYNPLYKEIRHVQLENRIFNFGVNAGKRTSVRILQHTINKMMDIPLLKVDGLFGRNTLSAVRNVDRDRLYREYIIEVEDYYRSLNKPQFIKGWLRRLSRLVPRNVVRKIKNWRDKQVEGKAR
jgi:lysozyme family protein